MTELSGEITGPAPGRTAWTRSLQAPLKDFLRTETGSAAFLLAAAVVALIWINVDASSYARVWEADIAIRIGDSGITQDVRGWINTGLMTFFFFVVGLEARREFDLGELRERRRVTLPLAAGVAGMVVPVLIFLAFNHGTSATHGWGTAMSTDTAFALGMLALVGPRFPGRLRAFVLTVIVVDDVVALLVIAFAYSENVAARPLIVGLLALGAVLVVRSLRVRYGPLYAAIGLVAWVAFFKSGVDPVVVGLAMGLMAYAYPVARSDLERATEVFRLFREQPTPELERSARSGLRAAVSPNERLQAIWHPWTSYVIVPIFALANAGIVINASFLARAYTSAITLGILVGYVVGKPVGVVGASWLTTKLSRGRLRPPVGWAAVLGGGTIAGIGFTVSILIATLAFSGARLEEAKLGILSSAVCAPILTWVIFQVTRRLPAPLKIRALLGTSESIVDLAADVDPERDHIRGAIDAPVTLVEYGDFECPYCGQAEPAVRELLTDHGDLRYVWRQLPLNDVHPHAQLAAEASEAAALQDSFWGMHDLLLDHQGTLEIEDLVGFARELHLDIDRFTEDLLTHTGAAHIAEDVDSADLSGVGGTPTFFVNGRRHHGAYDLATLTALVKAAKARAMIAA